MKYELDKVKGYTLSQLPKDSIKELEEVSLESASEGIVLVKNDNNVLPLKKGEKVSLFGRGQIEYYKSGTGSGGLVNVKYVTNILDELRKDSDIEVNEELATVYADWIKEHPFDVGQGWAQEPWCQEEMEIDIAEVEKARKFGDKAIVIIGRTAGEDKDNSATEGSYLLTLKEEKLLENVTKCFDKVIVVLNVGNIIDMNWIDKYSISSVLYLWQGGMCGGTAAANVLTGKVNPSGKLVDTVAYSINDYPSSANFGNEDENIYKEDIYVGYRYFETFAKEKVMYPFGYGLSYTDFEVKSKVAQKKGKIIIKSKVRNVGTYEGKEVIQVYFEAPQGKLGKPSRQLCAFVKTPLIAPKKSVKVTCEFDVNQMVSYDDSGKSGYKNCYVLESGEYNIYVGTDVRNARKEFTYKTDATTVTEKCTEALTPTVKFDRLKPDADMKPIYEEVPTRTYSLEERIKKNIPVEIAYTGDKGIKLSDVRSGKNTIDEFIAQLSDSDLACIVRGEGMNSPKVTQGTGSCFGGMSNELISFGIPIACTTDGPSGIRMDGGGKATSMPNGTCLACTFNTELIEKLYVLEGIEMTAYDIDVILGPGINIHRSPLNGRNFEYFSEDPYLTGKMASAISRAVRQAGVYCTVKHFMANSQEKNRYGCNSVISERAIREIYAKPFEMAVKEGGAKAIMTAYNLLNGLHTASSYDLTTTLLRDEWKYDGFVMTDWWAMMTSAEGVHSKEDTASMVRAQNDVYMVVGNDAPNYADNTVTSLNEGKLSRAELQRCAKNLCEFLMHTHAYERFIANGSAYDFAESVSTDTSNLAVTSTLGESKPGEKIVFSKTKDGRCVIEFEISSPLGGIAQITIDVNIENAPSKQIVTQGSEGQKKTVCVAIVAPAGEQKITLSSQAEINIYGVKIYE